MSALRSGIAVFSLGILLAAPASAITRDEVMVRARAFAHHPWRMTSSNVRGTCSSAYTSVYTPGDYMGLPYDWGGYMTVATFDQSLKDGAGAGSYPSDGIIACAVGLDCSGFVSQSWTASHTTTSGMSTVSSRLSSTSQLLAGDVMNSAGYHVSMYSHALSNGQPVWIESIDYGVHVNAFGGWSWTDGWDPRRYNQITGTTVQANPVGTNVNPIVIPSLPYSDSRDTSQSIVDFFDSCGAARTKNESGPEFVYKVVVTQPGTLTAAINDDSGVDIDPHIYSSLNTNDCVARNDTTATATVDCGTYYVVADTFVSSGVAKSGHYTINVSLTPSGAGCGSNGPKPWNFVGEPGDRCSFPGDDSLPPCNPNLGSETCIYTSGTRATSWCSHARVGNSDCAEFAGGCCDEIGNGEKYCMPSSYCGGTTTPDAGSPNVNTQDAGFHDADLDAGAPVVFDAGTTVVDAGTTTPDAGTSTVPDAGPVTHDAGQSENPVDAGTTEPPADAGAVDPGEPDAGEVTTGDADAGDPPTTTPGCGCGGANPGWMLVFGLVRRRRQRSA